MQLLKRGVVVWPGVVSAQSCAMNVLEQDTESLPAAHPDLTLDLEFLTVYFFLQYLFQTLIHENFLSDTICPGLILQNVHV